MNEPTHIDICSGIGGFAIAAAWAGFRTTAFCEIDPYCQKVLQKNFGAVAVADSRERSQRLFNGRAWGKWESPSLYSDLRQLYGRVFRGAALLTGGIPCQPASCAGKRRGKEDDRWLWPAALRFLGEALPAFAVFENPPGILALEGGLVFETLLSEMESFGYEVCPPIVVPACGVQADYYRYRVFVVAHLDHQRKLQPERSQSEFGRWSGNCVSHDAIVERSGLEIGKEQHRGECASTLGSGGPILPETHFELLRGIPGLPNRVDRNRRARIHALGNSVVPAQVYPILKAIQETMTTSH